MAVPVQRKVKVLQAEYVKDAQSILIVGECQEGRLRHQINRSCFSFGNRTEEEIIVELEKTAEMMIGKTINLVFDTELDGKMNDHVNLKY